jgi:hypothetical protein
MPFCLGHFSAKCATACMSWNVNAKVVTHAKYVVFQLAEVPVPRTLFAGILDRIGRLRPG